MRTVLALYLTLSYLLLSDAYAQPAVLASAPGEPALSTTGPTPSRNAGPAGSAAPRPALDEALAAGTPAARPGSITLHGAWPSGTSPLVVEVLDLVGRPVLRQPRATADGTELWLPVPTLPAATYVIRVLDGRGTELHRETVAYRPRR